MQVSRPAAVAALQGAVSLQRPSNSGGAAALASAISSSGDSTAAETLAGQHSGRPSGRGCQDRSSGGRGANRSPLMSPRYATIPEETSADDASAASRMEAMLSVLLTKVRNSQFTDSSAACLMVCDGKQGP